MRPAPLDTDLPLILPSIGSFFPGRTILRTVFTQRSSAVSVRSQGFPLSKLMSPSAITVPVPSWITARLTVPPLRNSTQIVGIRQNCIHNQYVPHNSPFCVCLVKLPCYPAAKPAVPLLTGLFGISTGSLEIEIRTSTSILSLPCALHSDAIILTAPIPMLKSSMFAVSEAYVNLWWRHPALCRIVPFESLASPFHSGFVTVPVTVTFPESCPLKAVRRFP